MARLNASSVLLAILIGSVAMYSLPISISASFLEGVPPAGRRDLPPALMKFLAECANHTARECGDQALRSVFGSETISDKCCRNLVAAGQDCFDGFIKFYAHENFNKAPMSESLAKSKQVYDKCASMAATPPSNTV